MQPAQNASPGPRVIVLNKPDLSSDRLVKCLLVPRLEDESAFIMKNAGPNHQNARQRCCFNFHQRHPLKVEEGFMRKGAGRKGFWTLGSILSVRIIGKDFEPETLDFVEMAVVARYQRETQG